MEFVKDYVPEDTGTARLQASRQGLQAFVDSRYGLSMHWGLYALNGRGEWVMHTERIPWDTYRDRLAQFNPTRFNAEEWADLMLESGQKFLLITSKHHDGFCMWDTALTDWKITNTPFKRDVLAELAPALRERGLQLHFYYSLLDWTHPAYRNDWPAYVAYYQGQLRELCTYYGELGGIIFDGYWPRTVFDASTAHFRSRGRLGSVRHLRPDPRPAAQRRGVQQPPYPAPARRGLPGLGARLSRREHRWASTPPPWAILPKAVWWNLNSGWAYAPRIHAVKSPETILRSMRKAHGLGAVFMLNVGPRPYGDIHPEEALALRQIGQQMRDYRLA